MSTIAQNVTPIKHYASYLVQGQEVSGTAELVCGSGYLFRPEGQRQAVLVSYKDSDLLLYGRCDIAETQRAADDARHGYAAIACAREMLRA
jgi:hypothetical protein